MSGAIVPQISAPQKPLVIANIEIHQDEFGRYSLNSLQDASEARGKKSKAPNKWLENKSTQELIAELTLQTPNSGCGVLEVVNGGNRHGTYAHEILAVEYAGWISPAFRIKVNQAFIDIDILPRLKHVGFWDQRFKLTEASLTEPPPAEDAPSA